MHTEFWWGKPFGRHPLLRLRKRWEDKFKMARWIVRVLLP